MPTKSRKFAYSYRLKLYSDDVPVAIERDECKYSMSILSLAVADSVYAPVSSLRD